MNEIELTPDYRSGRQMFPYSVVLGGLRNLRDAEDSVDSDPVVALHYRDLHIENLLLRRTAAAMDVFVSYRVQNAIYWTSHRIHLAKGELVTRRVHRSFLRRNPHGSMGGFRLLFPLPIR